MNIWQPYNGNNGPKHPRYQVLRQKLGPDGNVIEPNHYHIIYEGVPNFNESFRTHREAALEVKRVADACEPHVEYTEEGPVRVETRLKGRTGLHWIELEVAGCIKRACTPKPVLAIVS